MAREGRAGLCASLLAIAVALMAVSVAAAPLGARAQDAAPIEAGSGPLGEPSFRFVGQSAYRADRVELYGYLTHVVGLDRTRLFVGEPASVGTARFTFVAEIEGASSTNRADVTITDGAGTLRIYFDDAGGAAWNDPSSFSEGEQVAELSLDLRETLQRQAPGVGVLVGDGRTAQTAAAEFGLDEDRVRFGHEGVARRLRYTGALIGNLSADVNWTATLTGAATVTGRESLAIPVGEPPTMTAAATPVAPGAACPALQPWLGQTLDALDQAAVPGAAFASVTALEDVDAGALQDAADRAAALAAAQRDRAAPPEASAAHRLAVTALSTVARGLQAMAAALDANDAAAFDGARATLRDGNSLLGRAADAADALAASCPG